MKKIQICDMTLCNENRAFSFKEKIEIARQLERLRVDVIEIPEVQNTKTDTLFVRTASSFVKNSIISVEIGQTPEGVDNAAAALSAAARPRMRLSLPMSPVCMEYTCHKKADGMLEMIAVQISYAKQKCEDVEFCALDATRAETDFLHNAISTAISAGATAITVCDNAAEGMPDDFSAFVSELIEKIPGMSELEVGVMCEDKNGMSCACAMLSVKAGASAVKTAVDGNITPTATFAGIIKNCGNNCGFSADIKQTELNRIVKQISWIISGGKDARPAAQTGFPDENGIRLDSKDNQEDVIAAVNKLGYDLSEEDAAKVYEEFRRVAEKKTVGAKELDAIVASAAMQVPPTYKVISYVVNTGNIITASAQLRLQKGESELAGICMGDGPIDAAFLAIEQIVGHHYELDDFQIHSVTEGKEAVASAVIRLRYGGKLYSGNGVSTDIVGASIRAYVNAINKIVYEEA